MEDIVFLDREIIFWVQAHLTADWLSQVSLFLTWLGDYGGIWLLLGVLLVLRRKSRPLGLAILLSWLLAALVGSGLLKHLVMRPRPCIDYPAVKLLLPAPSPTDYSFPSGHAFTSFAAVAAVWRKLPWYLYALLVALACGIGFSRVYLFFHYPSDVLVGAALGIACGILAGRVVQKLCKA